MVIFCHKLSGNFQLCEAIRGLMPLTKSSPGVLSWRLEDEFSGAEGAEGGGHGGGVGGEGVDAGEIIVVVGAGVGAEEVGLVDPVEGLVMVRHGRISTAGKPAG
jgi:hypothetical protein